MQCSIPLSPDSHSYSTKPLIKILIPKRKKKKKHLKCSVTSGNFDLCFQPIQLMSIIMPLVTDPIDVDEEI